VYYARARRLGLDHRVVSEHPDVERVQAIGILAFYLLIIGSIARQAYSPQRLTLTEWHHRAWNALGQAACHATALGMHLRVTDPDIDEEEKDRRARTCPCIASRSSSRK
jgi:hypothetical protein